MSTASDQPSDDSPENGPDRRPQDDDLDATHGDLDATHGDLDDDLDATYPGDGPDLDATGLPDGDGLPPADLDATHAGAAGDVDATHSGGGDDLDATHAGAPFDVDATQVDSGHADVDATEMPTVVPSDTDELEQTEPDGGTADSDGDTPRTMGGTLQPARVRRVASRTTEQVPIRDIPTDAPFDDDELEVDATSGPDFKNDPDCLIGRDFGAFHIKGLLGQGAMGTVYLAHYSKLGRDEALKLLTPNLSTDVLRRFQEEARHAAKLREPTTAEVYDYESAEIDGAQVAFIRMEYCAGGTLKEHFQKFPGGYLPVREADRLLREAVKSMHEAERQGLVHCDLKPANILLQKTDSNSKVRNVRVADFGLAARADEAELSEGEKRAYTPLYASPEQWRDARTIDVRTDIYSLGATFFHALTGNSGPSAYLDQLENKLTRPMVREFVLRNAPHLDPLKFRQDLPQHLAAVIVRMTSRDIDVRYASFAEVLQDLERGDADYDTLIREAKRRTRRTQLLAAGVVVLLLAAVGTYLAFFRPERSDVLTAEVVEAYRDEARTSYNRLRGLEKPVDDLVAAFDTELGKGFGWNADSAIRSSDRQRFGALQGSTSGRNTGYRHAISRLRSDFEQVLDERKSYHEALTELAGVTDDAGDPVFEKASFNGIQFVSRNILGSGEDERRSAVDLGQSAEARFDAFRDRIARLGGHGALKALQGDTAPVDRPLLDVIREVREAFVEAKAEYDKQQCSGALFTLPAVPDETADLLSESEAEIVSAAHTAALDTSKRIVLARLARQLDGVKDQLESDRESIAAEQDPTSLLIQRYQELAGQTNSDEPSDEPPPTVTDRRFVRLVWGAVAAHFAKDFGGGGSGNDGADSMLLAGAEAADEDPFALPDAKAWIATLQGIRSRFEGELPAGPDAPDEPSSIASAVAGSLEAEFDDGVERDTMRDVVLQDASVISALQSIDKALGSLTSSNQQVSDRRRERMRQRMVQNIESQSSEFASQYADRLSAGMSWKEAIEACTDYANRKQIEPLEQEIKTTFGDVEERVRTFVNTLDAGRASELANPWRELLDPEKSNGLPKQRTGHLNQLSAHLSMLERKSLELEQLQKRWSGALAGLEMTFAGERGSLSEAEQVRFVVEALDSEAWFGGLEVPASLRIRSLHVREDGQMDVRFGWQVSNALADDVEMVFIPKDPELGTEAFLMDIEEISFGRVGALLGEMTVAPERKLTPYGRVTGAASAAPAPVFSYTAADALAKAARKSIPTPSQTLAAVGNWSGPWQSTTLPRPVQLELKDFNDSELSNTANRILPTRRATDDVHPENGLRGLYSGLAELTFDRERGVWLRMGTSLLLDSNSRSLALLYSTASPRLPGPNVPYSKLRSDGTSEASLVCRNRNSMDWGVRFVVNLDGL